MLTTGWGGGDDFKKAITLILTVDALLRQAKMNLTKWVTNSHELKDALGKRITFSNEPSMLAMETSFEHKAQKALDVIWDPVTDRFAFNATKIADSAAKKATQ